MTKKKDPEEELITKIVVMIFLPVLLGMIILVITIFSLNLAGVWGAERQEYAIGVVSSILSTAFMAGTLLVFFGILWMLGYPILWVINRRITSNQSKEA